MHAIALDSCEVEQCCFVFVAMQFSYPRHDLVQDAGRNPVRIALPASQDGQSAGRPRHSVRFLSDDQSDLALAVIILLRVGHRASNKISRAISDDT